MVRRFPLLARWLLSLFVPADWRADVIGDLEEEFRRRSAEVGWFSATVGVWRVVPGFCWRFGLERARSVGRPEGLSSLDLKLALRSAARSPALSLLSVVSLAVGIGMATGVFAIVKGSFFVDLPFEGGERIVLVQDYDRTGGFAVELGSDEFMRRRDALGSFEFLGAYYSRPVVFGEGRSLGRTVSARFVSEEILAMTGVLPRLGRLPDRSDARPGAEPGVVLPHFLWATDLGADPQALGSSVFVGGERRTVIGVMPEGFGFPQGNELWVPLNVRDTEESLRMVGKLREGVDAETARAELATVAVPDPAYAQAEHEITHLVTSLTRPVVSDSTTWWLAAPIGAFVLLLLVMATNVANLVLAKNATRSGEIAVRSALGASRRRIIGQLALETTVLVTLATGVGLGMAVVGLGAFQARVQLPVWTDLSLDPWVVAFAIGLAASTVLVAGVIPARKATGSGVLQNLKAAGRPGGSVRFGRVTGTLIVVELALCVAFLSVAAVLGQSLLSFGFTRYDLPARETLVAQIYHGWPRELQDPDDELAPRQREDARREFLESATRNAEAIRAGALTLPGVRFAAYGSRFPGNQSETVDIEVDGGSASHHPTEFAEVGPGYFELLGAEALRGRPFLEAEHQGEAGVVIVNQPFAEEHFGRSDPVGRRLRARTAEPEGDRLGPWLEIVGVVPDLGLNPGDPSQASGVYFPLPDRTVTRLALRGEGDPSRWTPLLMEQVRQVDPSIDVQWARTLDSLVREPAAIYRGLGIGFLVFGWLALVLSAASIHALSGSAVTNRTHEIGVRQALGAGSTSIVVAVLRRAMAQFLIGALLGTVLAVGLLRIGEMFPWPLKVGSPLALVGVAAVLLVSNLIAVGGPLRRVLAIQPSDALRSE